MYPDVELSRTEPFGHSEGVDERSTDVESGHQCEPAERVVLDRSAQSLHDDHMNRRKTSAHQAKRYEQRCTQLTLIGFVYNSDRLASIT